ncbi:MAG: DsbA family protein [Candidatus Dormibacteraeota bacterium]|nr:DsbA family protein [Candidatus Dormibacteraeota bacterium]
MEIDWKPFWLHPEIPRRGRSRDELLGERGGRVSEGLRRLAAEDGLELNPSEVVSDAHPALEMTEFAREQGALHPFHRAVMDAYWLNGRDIGDLGVLADCAAAAGLDREAAVLSFTHGTYTGLVVGTTQAAARAGITGTPAWLINHHYLVMGAQPLQTLVEVVERVQAEESQG